MVGEIEACIMIGDRRTKCVVCENITGDYHFLGIMPHTSLCSECKLEYEK